MNNLKFQEISINQNNKITSMYKLPNNDLIIVNSLGIIFIYDSINFSIKSSIDTYKGKKINSFSLTKNQNFFLFPSNNNIVIMEYSLEENKIISKEEIINAHDNKIIILEVIELYNYDLCSHGNGNLIKIWKKIKDKKYQNLITLKTEGEIISSVIEINKREIFSVLGLNSTIIFWEMGFWRRKTIKKINVILSFNCACLLNKYFFCVCCNDSSIILIKLDNKEIIKKIYLNCLKIKYNVITKLKNKFLIFSGFFENIKTRKKNTIIQIFQFHENKLEFELINQINNPHEKVIKEIFELNDKQFISISGDNIIKIWENSNKNLLLSCNNILEEDL